MITEMEKICLSPLICDARENQEDEIAEEIICAKSEDNLSPILKTVTLSKKSKLFPYVDDDIPSYQIVHGSKRFSDMSEEQESILPISPVVTPPRVTKKENFQVPFVPTIGTIVKNSAGSKVSLSENINVITTNESTKKYRNAYDMLGMVDNDISWNSSMETPTHKLLPSDDYNTIERATLLPEKEAVNMQPRVLFSPYENDESECLPLKYSSESDDEKDLCSTKLQSPTTYEINITAKSSGSLKGTTGIKSTITNGESPKGIVADDSFIKNSILSPISPVFRINKKKSKTKQQKSILVKSPDIAVENNVKNSNDKNVCETDKDMICDIDLCNEVPVTDLKETNNDNDIIMNDQSETFQDDSFQNISFSCFDELYNTSDLVNESNTTYNTDFFPEGKKQNDCGRSDSQKYNIEKNSSPAQEKITSNKFCFYDSSRTDELRPVISLDDFLKSAKQLEVNVMSSDKTYETFNESELMVFKDMVNDEFSGRDVKRTRTDSEKSLDNCHKKDMEILNVSESFLELDDNDDGRMEVEHVKKQEDSLKVLTAQSGINDNQICMTAICRERLIDSGNNATCCEKSFIHANEKTNNDQCQDKYVENSKSNEPGTQREFLTTLGPTTSIPPSNELDKKTLNIFKHDHREEFTTELDNKENDKMLKSGFQGFKTASGAPIKISEKSLNRAKKLFLESDVSNIFPATDNFPEHSGFRTVSGIKIQVSEQSLEKGLQVFCDLDGASIKENTKMMTEVKEKKFLGFKTASNNLVKISEESLKKANELWKQMENISVDKGSISLQDSEPKGNTLREKTSSVSEAADESFPLIKPDSRFCGFSTASGKNLTVSHKALTKAHKMFNEEMVGPETKEMTEKTESVNIVCPKESTEVIVNEKEDNFTQFHEEENFEDSGFIPDWLHVYNTSPTFTKESVECKSATSFEYCIRNSTPEERYLIKSPILGKTDRFFNKGKRKKSSKKLFFQPSNQKVFDEDEDISDYARMKNPSVKRDSSNLDIDYNIPFKKKKVEENVADNVDNKIPNLSSEVISGREKARLEQVKAGNKLKVNPVKGSHILKKTQKQLSWNEALKGTFPGRYSDEILQTYGIRNDVLEITATNAVKYRFRAEDFFTSSSCLSNIDGFLVGDGCLLIFDDDNTAGVEEIARAFLASPGVEPKLISPEWIKNHYKWIVWKFSHYERSFPHVFGGNCLTPHNVMVQLKYRYDREIDCSERSALKKILEQDESSRRRIVLCVSGIKKSSDLCNENTESSRTVTTSYLVELTDGWYSCCVQTDPAMCRFIEEGKVIIGTKIITHGAQLLLGDVSPLEVKDNVHLKIFTNSTRRVKWDTKLGFQKCGGPFLLSLNSILPNGGLVGRLDVVIVRVYPILYMEKKSDGNHVLRNSRTEDIAASAYQEQQEAIFEKIYQQAKDEIQSKAKEKEKLLKKLTISDVSKITDAEELFRLYESCCDPSSFQNLLTVEQNEILVDYQLRMKEINNKELSDMVQEKIKTEKMNARVVTQLLRVKIVDLHKPDYDNPVLFTIWDSTEDDLRMLPEGKAISIFNTVPNNSRFHKPLQLNSTRFTQYKEITKTAEYPARKLASLKELTADYEPVFNEIDVVGIVAFIRETSYGSRLSQTVYLTDLEYNFIGLVFWGSCKNLGWENVLTVGSVVAGCNLQWGNRRYFSNIPNVYVTEYSVFKENPKESFLEDGIKLLRSSLPEDMKNFISKCEDEIMAKLEDQKLSNVSKSSSYSLDSSNNSTTTIKPKYINAFKMKPNASSTPFKSRAFGLDTSDQEPSPIQKRIEILKMYGEPPPLPPLPHYNLDKVNTKFKPPYKSAVDPSAK